MRISRLSLMVVLALVLCAVVADASGCAPTGAQAPAPQGAEPKVQEQPDAPAPSGSSTDAATGAAVPPGITGSKYAGMQVVGYLVPREGEWTVYDADPGSDEGAVASPLAALVPGKVDQAGIEAFSGRYISADGTPSPGDDVPQIRVDKIEAAVAP